MLLDESPLLLESLEVDVLGGRDDALDEAGAAR